MQTRLMIKVVLGPQDDSEKGGGDNSSAETPVDKIAEKPFSVSSSNSQNTNGACKSRNRDKSTRSCISESNQSLPSQRQQSVLGQPRRSRSRCTKETCQNQKSKENHHHQSPRQNRSLFSKGSTGRQLWALSNLVDGAPKLVG